MRGRRFRYVEGKGVVEVTERPALRHDALASGYSEAKPLVSAAMSCHPDQAAMMNQEVQREGIRGVKYDENGRCLITSREGRRRWMPKFGERVGIPGVHDNDGGFGDG